MNLALSLLLLAAPPSLTIPSEIRGEPGQFIVVRAESDSPWVNFRADGGLAVFPAGLLADRKATVVTAKGPGRYTLHAYAGNTDGGVDADVVIVVGDAPPVPVPPEPPKPTPPKPEPTPPPVVAGKRELMIVRESADVTTPLAATLVKLRNGPSFDYLKAKGHTLSILDKDSVNENGQPSKLVEAWRPHFAGMTLPVLFIIDAQTRQLLHKQSIPPEYTADNIIERLRENGG